MTPSAGPGIFDDELETSEVADRALATRLSIGRINHAYGAGARGAVQRKKRKGNPSKKPKTPASLLGGPTMAVVVVDSQGRALKRWVGRAQLPGGTPSGAFVARKKGGKWVWNDRAGATARIKVNKDKPGILVERWAKSAKRGVRIVVRFTDPKASQGKGGTGTKGTGTGGEGGKASKGNKGGAPSGTSSGRVPVGPDGMPIETDEESGGSADGSPDGVVGGSGEAHHGAGKGEEAAEGESSEGSVGGTKDGTPGGPGLGDGPRTKQNEHGTKHGSKDGPEAGYRRDEGGEEGGSLKPEDGGATGGVTSGDAGGEKGGVRGAIGIFGLIHVPEEYRAAVELGLIALDVAPNPGAFVKKAVKGAFKKMGKNGIRAVVKKEAAQFAKAEVRKLEKEFAEDLEKLTVAERKKLRKHTEGLYQRKYFDRVEAAATEQREGLEVALGAAKNAKEAKKLKSKIVELEKLEDAVAVKPVGGRLPENHQFAGGPFKGENVKGLKGVKNPSPKQLDRAKKLIDEKGGVQFTREGYPDFSPWTFEKNGIKADVRIRYTGDRGADFAAARDEMRRLLNDPTWEKPPGYTWHHHEDVGRMVLVKREVHQAVAHTGGVPHYRELIGDPDAYTR